jgi:hypothetical protein
MKCIKVALDSFEKKLATQIGDGDVCLGIRRAIVLTGLRAEEQKGCAGVKQNQEPDQLTMVTNQMAALAEELKHVADNPSRREEIAIQLVRLGKLYLSVQAGGDSSLDDR